MRLNPPLQFVEKKQSVVLQLCARIMCVCERERERGAGGVFIYLYTASRNTFNHIAIHARTCICIMFLNKIPSVVTVLSVVPLCQELRMGSVTMAPMCVKMVCAQDHFV